MDILYVILEVLIILGIIALGAFIIVLIADLILSSFDGHKGIFFNRNKEPEVQQPAPEPYKPEEPVATVAPYYEELAKNSEEVYVASEPEVISSVDFQKAAEEQKLIKRRGMVEDVKPVKTETMFEDVADDDDVELTKAITDVSKKALKEIEAENNEKRKQAEREKEEALRKEKEEQALREQELKRQKEELERQLEEERKAREQEKEQVKEVVKVVEVKDEGDKELKRLRDDIFTLRRSAFKDMHEVKSNSHENEMEKKMKEIDKLNAHRKALHKEKEELLRYKNEAINRESQLEQISNEKAELEREIAELKRQTEESKKPYYTKEYYTKRLESLQAELKEVEKELRANKREFIPLQRIKKSYDRDQEKLRRKEAIVAKQKIALYGVKSSANVDPKKREKLDEDVKLLNQLKESVFQCDQVLKQNKDRYPVLEKSNKLLTKTYNRLVREIENVNAALDWYEENEK